uniref:Lipoprotein n=1 Tax=Rhizophora mucronata TaxID=61149 RepID=A0A2P2IX40_RHIMU
MRRLLGFVLRLATVSCSSCKTKIFLFHAQETYYFFFLEEKNQGKNSPN